VPRHKVFATGPGLLDGIKRGSPRAKGFDPVPDPVSALARFVDLVPESLGAASSTRELLSAAGTAYTGAGMTVPYTHGTVVHHDPDDPRDSSMQQAGRDGPGSRDDMHAITTTLLCDAYGLTRRLSLTNGHEVYAKTYFFVPEAAAELANAQDEYAAMLLALHQAGQSTSYDGLFTKSKTVVAEIALTLYLSDFLLCNPGLHANRAHTLMPPREVGMEWVQRSRRLVVLMLKQSCIVNPILDGCTTILFPELMVSCCLVCVVPA
jgi:hypothetical protein